MRSNFHLICFSSLLLTTDAVDSNAVYHSLVHLKLIFDPFSDIDPLIHEEGRYKKSIASYLNETKSLWLNKKLAWYDWDTLIGCLLSTFRCLTIANCILINLVNVTICTFDFFSSFKNGSVHFLSVLFFVLSCY